MTTDTKEAPKPLDISMELERIYTYGSGETFSIVYPKTLWVLSNGSHRVLDAAGIVHRPTPNFVGISWVPKNSSVPFVA
jgi:hypothetical protein